MPADLLSLSCFSSLCQLPVRLDLGLLAGFLPLHSCDKPYFFTVAFDLGGLLNSLGLEFNKIMLGKKIKETDFQTISSDRFLPWG